MKEITVLESKKLQLHILSKIHDFCGENHLRYYLVFGSLLGAVRHKGFIPWDDDIDVSMPREDYHFFMENFGEQDSCKAICCERDSSYYLPFGKVIDTRTVLKENISNSAEIGVYVDIFPLDGLSESKKKNRRIVQKLLFRRNLLALKILPNSKKRKGWRKYAHSILRRILFFLNMNQVSQSMNKLAQSFSSGENSTQFGQLANVDASGIQREYPAPLFSERVLYDFENFQFYGPKDYDSYLKLVYGDYMRLPSEEARVCKHEYAQYWK